MFEKLNLYDEKSGRWKYMCEIKVFELWLKIVFLLLYVYRWK